jgi:hypothetical protein
VRDAETSEQADGLPRRARRHRAVGRRAEADRHPRRR